MIIKVEEENKSMFASILELVDINTDKKISFAEFKSFYIQCYLKNNS